jgi:hypothetical protein
VPADTLGPVEPASRTTFGAAVRCKRVEALA